MLRRATAIVMLFAFAAHLAGCYKNSTISISPNAARSGRDSRFVGVTTRNAEYVRFDVPAVINAGRITGRVHGAPYEIDADSVQYFWVERRQFDGTKTALAVIGAGVAAVVVAVASGGSDEPPPPPPPQTESCPFIYSWDGSQWVFDAEPYGGAISRGLERDDYAELEHLRPEDKRYRLMVRNELEETQHTNLTELWIADHSPDVSIAADVFGGLYTLRDLEPPLAASDGQGRDLLPWLRADDKLIWEPEPVAGDDPSLRQEIVMTFPKPHGATRVKLVARAATALWGSHMILEMLGLRGNELAQWYANVDNGLSEAAALFTWNLREELYALQVAVEEPSGWVVRGMLPGGGPFISENRVVVLDVSRVQGDRVRIRLRPPVGFWALNSFALDATPDEQIHVTRLTPASAQDARGNDLRSMLSHTDDSYHVMSAIGDVAYLDFAAPAPVPGTKRTVFLHTRGWYRVHLETSGEPNLASLGQVFDMPGGATQLSAERYAEWLAATRTGEGSHRR
jgi:hypothetical protein